MTQVLFIFQGCSRYQQYFLQPILNCLSDESVDLRQTASYTLGILGQFGGPEFFKYCSGLFIRTFFKISNNPS